MRPASPRTLGAALWQMARHPHEVLWRRWNWKSAITSSFVRGMVFLVANLPAGAGAALQAMAVELALRAMTAGFYGAITERFRSVRPRRHAMAAAVLLLPALAHSLELVVHFVNGTPRLAASLALSVALTIVSTSFNLFAMQRRVFIVGRGHRPLRDDLARVPRLLIEFAAAIGRRLRSRSEVRARRRGLSVRRT